MPSVARYLIHWCAAFAAVTLPLAAAHAQIPANNTRANAQPLLFDGSSAMWMVHFAESEGAVPTTCGGANDQDVWFSGTATANDTLWVRLCYQDWPNTLQVFRAGAGGTLGAQVACVAVPAGVPCGSAGFVSWAALAGEAFYIRLACNPQAYYGGGFTLASGAYSQGTPQAPPPPATVTGADIVTGDCWGVSSFGTGTVNGQSVRAFAVGGDAWNRGTQTLAWYPNTNRHPVIAQNMYRDLNGRFDNIGLGWLKHGFASENAERYGPCATHFGNGSTLGTNCADAYSSSQNGGRSSLGPRWDVNPITGVYTANWNTLVPPTPTDVPSRRIQVPTADWANPGAEYWVDVHYLCSDDASWNHGRNNVSARRVITIPSSNTYTSTSIFRGSITEQSTTALQAWAARVNTITPDAVRVILVDFHELSQPALDVNGAASGPLTDCYGQFQVYSRVTDLGNGQWNYLYGVYNVNSHRAAGALRLRLPAGAAAAAYTFKAPLYHSGERIDNSPWTSSLSAGVLALAFNPVYPPTMTLTGIGTVNVQPNYVYWGSMYTYSFTCAVPPVTGIARLKLGRPPANATGYQGDSLAVNGLQVPAACPADLGVQGGTLGVDGILDNNDFVAFITAFFDNDMTSADIGLQGGTPGGDNQLDNNDFVVFIEAYFQGCP